MPRFKKQHLYAQEHIRLRDSGYYCQMTSSCNSGQGSQIRQIWRILRQNFSDDSTEVTEGVTLTPEIFGNKQKATATPEIFGNKQFCPYLFRNKYNLR